MPRAQLKDLTGCTFERLKVIGRAENYKSPNKHTVITQWLCECKCGNVVVVPRHNLKSGATKSCGCLKKDLLKERAKKKRGLAE